MLLSFLVEGKCNTHQQRAWWKSGLSRWRR